MTATPANVLALRSPPVGAPLRERDDDQLMLLACAGLEAALSELVRRYEGRVRSYCMKWDAARGEDLAQEVFIALWKTRERYRPEGRFPVYLFTLVKNRCRNAVRDLLRWRRFVEARPKEPEAAEPGQLDALIAGERERRAREAIASLKPKLREAVLLRFDQGLSYAELAAIAGVPEVTARARVFQGLKKLREGWPGGEP